MVIHLDTRSDTENSQIKLQSSRTDHIHNSLVSSQNEEVKSVVALGFLIKKTRRRKLKK